jgi:hypothetical protein
MRLNNPAQADFICLAEVPQLTRRLNFLLDFGMHGQ